MIKPTVQISLKLVGWFYTYDHYASIS